MSTFDDSDILYKLVFERRAEKIDLPVMVGKISAITASDFKKMDGEKLIDFMMDAVVTYRMVEVKIAESDIEEADRWKKYLADMRPGFELLVAALNKLMEEQDRRVQAVIAEIRSGNHP
jgi:hypothetical protein